MTKTSREEQFEYILEENGILENPAKIKRCVWEFICNRVDELKDKNLLDEAKQWEVAEHIVYDMLDEDEDEDASNVRTVTVDGITRPIDENRVYTTIYYRLFGLLGKEEMIQKIADEAVFLISGIEVEDCPNLETKYANCVVDYLADGHSIEDLINEEDSTIVFDYL